MLNEEHPFSPADNFTLYLLKSKQLHVKLNFNITDLFILRM